MTERTLLIGGAGFIGSGLARELVQSGHDVTVLDAHRASVDPFTADYGAAQRYRRGLLSGARVLRGDACDPLDMLTAFEAARPHRVVHLVALAHAPLNEHHLGAAVQAATTSMINTLEMAKRHQTRRVLLVSSSYVYGNFRYIPCDERHATEPHNAYGAAKLAAEIVCRAIATSLEIPYTIVRLIAVYGPWDLNGKLSAQNLAEAAATGELPIIGRAHDAGTDYTHVDDAVRGLRLALEADNAAGEVINIARGRARTAHDVAEALTRLGYPARPARERVASRPKRGPLDITKARTVLGFNPELDLEDTLATCLEHAIDQQAGATSGTARQ